MANSTRESGNWIGITLDGATDWDITADLPHKLAQGLGVVSISVYAAATAIIICRDAKDANQTSPEIFHFVASAGQLCMQYLFGKSTLMYPAFHATDCGAGTVVIQLG